MSEEFSIKKALEDVVAVYLELVSQDDDLKKQRVIIDQRMSRLLLKIVSLANLTDDLPEDSLVMQIVKNVGRFGLTDAVRLVLKASGERMAATQVRDHLIRMGINLSRFKNPIASITTVLVRLNDKDEADIFYDKEADKWTFQWRLQKDAETLRRIPGEMTSDVMSKVAEIIVNEPRKKVRFNVIKKKPRKPKPKGTLKKRVEKMEKSKPMMR